MPCDYSKYPQNWKSEIVPRILRRAGGGEDDPRVGAKCEWCGVENYAIKASDGIVIAHRNSYKFARSFADSHNSNPDMIAEYGRASVVVLTIAHLDDPNPTNCADDNLAALCQKCHNEYDRPMRNRNRQAKRRQNRIDAGQLVLI